MRHAAQLPLTAVRLDKVLQTLAMAGMINFAVVDARRSVPLQRGDKDLTFKGLAPVKEQRGLLVAITPSLQASPLPPVPIAT